MTDSPKIIRAACLAVFKNKKILMAKGDDEEVFYFVGGGLEEGETDIDCLIREVKEEIDCDLEFDSITFLAEFEDLAHGKENTIVQLPFYTAKFIGEPKASREVEEIKYLDSSVDPKLLSKIANDKVYPWLKEHGHIN
jgi:8-oxo-dGTP diphosphatase